MSVTVIRQRNSPLLGGRQPTLADKQPSHPNCKIPASRKRLTRTRKVHRLYRANIDTQKERFHAQP
jgi:hypothetical protein